MGMAGIAKMVGRGVSSRKFCGVVLSRPRILLNKAGLSPVALRDGFCDGDLTATGLI
jgi:hypothetical protein